MTVIVFSVRNVDIKEESDSDSEPEAKRRLVSPDFKEETVFIPCSSVKTEPTKGQTWKTTDEEDVVPAPLPFRPVRRQGPQKSTRKAKTPLDFFKLFFTDAVLELLRDNLNEFGSRANPRWTAVTSADLYSFLAVVIYMGIVKVPEMADYWRRQSLFSLSFPPSVISRSRFEKILRFFHTAPLGADAQNEFARGTPTYDRLGKIKPLYLHIVDACKEHYQPDQNISIDERIIASRARIGLKRCIKNKPTRWGYKLVVLADSQTGYTWNFAVFRGKESNPGRGLGFESVMSLMDLEKLGTGYHLYIGDFYTSPQLFRDLQNLQLGACGTVRPNHAAFPKETPNDLGRRAPRGSIRWLRDAELLFVKWTDTREVNVCSTLHSGHAAETVQRRVKQHGEWKSLDVPVPVAVKDYNRYMGGVDRSDALIGHYTVLHKTQTWHRSFFYHCLDIAVANAHILFKAVTKTAAVSQKSFREKLIIELSENGSPSTSSSARHKPPATEAPPIAHLPHYLTEGLDVPKALAASSGRRWCRVCNKKTPVCCQTCSVALCFLPSRNCFRQYHDGS